MTIGVTDPDAHVDGWPLEALGLDADGVLADQVEIPEPAWTRAPERPKPKKKTTRKERRRR